MIWKELQKRIDNMTTQQLNSSINIALVNTDKYYSVIDTEFADTGDVLDINQPYLIVEL